jgi:tetratricopeptide (TPR) repeat protein
MKERFETNESQKVFLAFFLILVIALSSCGKKASSNESPAAIPPSNNPAFDAVAKDIRQSVKGLEYPDEVGTELVKMVSDWKCDIWKQKLDKAKQDLHQNKTTVAQMAQVEKEITRNLYDSILKEIKYNENYSWMDKIIKDKAANCLGYAQLYYILGNSIGLKTEGLNVLKLRTGSLPTMVGHTACLVDLNDGTVIMVDLAYKIFSNAFTFKDEFAETGNIWELKDNNNPLRIHKRIQLCDRSGFAAFLHICQGNEYSKSGKNIEAIKEYTKAIELFPKSDHAYIYRGHEYDTLNKTMESISDYTMAMELDPDNADPYVMRGYLYSKLDKYLEALKDLTRALELNKGYTKAYRIREYVCRNLSLYKMAESDANKAKVYTYFDRGKDFLRSAKYPEAISEYTKVIELDPNITKAYNNRGYSYDKLGQYDNAIADYNKAIELDPLYIEEYNDRGLMYRKLGKYTEAIDDFSKAIELDPYNDKAYYNRGVVEAKIGRIDDAKKDLQKVVQMNPASKEQVKAISDKFNLGL